MEFIKNYSDYILLTESMLDDLKKANVNIVDKNNVLYTITEDNYDEILKTSKKFFYLSWLIKKVRNNIIKMEDVYKFKDYFEIFNNNKRYFISNDISSIKTKDDVNNFIKKCIEVRDKNLEDIEVLDSEKFINNKDIDRLDKVGVKYYGIEEGVQIFEVTSSCKGNTNAFNLYRDILGKTKNGKIDLCTFTKESFEHYLDRGSLFILYNLSDNRSPYQIHFESKQYMDKNNEPFFE